MIINYIHKRKIAIVTGFFVAFNIVFASDFLCDVGIINKGHEQHDRDSDHHEKLASVNQESHDHGTQQYDQNHHKHDKQNKDEEDDCCEFEIDLVFTSLIKKDPIKFNLNEVPVFHNMPLDLPQDYTFIFYKKHNPNSLKNTLSPPMGGAQIRILYQSFLC